jgi:hypothetical protein
MGRMGTDVERRHGPSHEPSVLHAAGMDADNHGFRSLDGTLVAGRDHHDRLPASGHDVRIQRHVNDIISREPRRGRLRCPQHARSRRRVRRRWTQAASEHLSVLRRDSRRQLHAARQHPPVDALSSATTLPFYIGQTVYVKKPLTGTVASTTVSRRSPGRAASSSSNSCVAPRAHHAGRQRVRQLRQHDYIEHEPDARERRSTDACGRDPLHVDARSRLRTSPALQRQHRLYTVKVVRANRDADGDNVVPYPIVAGSLRPEKHVNDGANTTTGATLIIPNSPRANAQSINVTGAVCRSGVVREWNSGTGAIRFGNDITDRGVYAGHALSTSSAGEASGTSANVVSYNAATQTAIVDNQCAQHHRGTDHLQRRHAQTDGSSPVESAGTRGHGRGLLHLPSAQFAVGTRNFRLTDSANNVTSDATTSAETSYEASGISYTQQETSVSSRQLGLVARDRASESSRSRARPSRQGFDVQYVDPLAETFLVDAQVSHRASSSRRSTCASAAVPTDDIPVTWNFVRSSTAIQARTSLCRAWRNRESRPSRCVRTKSVTRRSADVRWHCGRSALTRFTFPAPVHLMPGKEYAIVVRSDSATSTPSTPRNSARRSSAHRTSSRSSRTRAASSSRRTHQTWTESPFEDLMFRLNRATWNASKRHRSRACSSRVLCRRSRTRASTASNSIHTTRSSRTSRTDYTLDIKPWTHNGRLDGPALLSATTRSQTSGSRSRPFDGAGLRRSYRREQHRRSASSAAVHEQHEHPSREHRGRIRLLHHLQPGRRAVRGLEEDELAVPCVISSEHGSVVPDDVIHQSRARLSCQPPELACSHDGRLAHRHWRRNTNFVTTLLVGDTLIVGGNLEFVVSAYHEHDTSHRHRKRAAHARRTRSGATARGRRQQRRRADTITRGTQTLRERAPRVMRASVQTARLRTSSSRTTAAATSTHRLSRFRRRRTPGFSTRVTLQSAASLKYNSEEAPSGGNGLTRYITRSVTLAEGFDARDLVVYFDAYRPVGSNFYVYYKVLAETRIAHASTTSHGV